MRTLIIAEAGVNHNGDLGMARELVTVAAAAGADMVKFQTFVTHKSIARGAPKADYQVRTTGGKDSQYDLVGNLELSRAEHEILIQDCESQGIRFFSTGFDPESLDLLIELGIDRIKVPSGEITNLPLLRHMATKGLPVILSTGMATLGEIEEAIAVFEEAGVSREVITVLHCNTEYPTPMGDVNLRAMNNMGAALGVKVGYSDHTLGTEIPVAAVALGATVIEKHFTLDRSLPGPDHPASLEPGELADMVRVIRNVELAMRGDGIKRPSASELKNRPIARKSLVALRDIQAGETFTAENITTKRPGSGISPMKWDDVIGRRAPANFLADELIQL